MSEKISLDSSVSNYSLQCCGWMFCIRIRSIGIPCITLLSAVEADGVWYANRKKVWEYD